MIDNNDLESLEHAVLTKMFQGDDPVLNILREQYAKVTIESRRKTAAGFYTYFSLPNEVKVVSHAVDFKFGDVKADISDLKNGAGFLVYVKNGKLSSLEAYSYEEPWPENVGEFSVEYSDGENRDLGKLRKIWEAS